MTEEDFQLWKQLPITKAVTTRLAKRREEMDRTLIALLSASQSTELTLLPSVRLGANISLLDEITAWNFYDFEMIPVKGEQ